VFLRPEEVSLAIGKGGMNIKLASMLTGYEIDVYRETGNEDIDDIYLDEFKDEIDGWVIDALKNLGLTTAKSVLQIPRDTIMEKADLEAETVDQVMEVLSREFEDEDEEADDDEAEDADTEAEADAETETNE
jgi:N utilization substance protein A